MNSSTPNLDHEPLVGISLVITEVHSNSFRRAESLNIAVLISNNPSNFMPKPDRESIAILWAPRSFVALYISWARVLISKPLRTAYFSMEGRLARLEAASIIISLFSSSRDSKSNPSFAASVLNSFGLSSRVTNTPASSYFVTPLCKNCIQKMVFPVPVPPEISIFDPLKNPPWNMLSKPGIPIFTLSFSLVFSIISSFSCLFTYYYFFFFDRRNSKF